MKKRIAITGVGCLTPLGITVDASWKALMNNESGLDLWVNGTEHGPQSVVAGMVKNGLEDSKYRKWPKYVEMMVCSADQAILDSKLPEYIDRQRVGICSGTGLGSIHSITKGHDVITKNGWKKVTPYLIPQILYNTAGSLIMQKYRFEGPSTAVSNACATGTSVIVHAINMIELGMADVMIATVAESCLDSLVMSGFSKIKALSTDSEVCPEDSSKPFDKKRSGFVISEGAGAIVLEDIDHAQKRNANIYGLISGYGMATDTHHLISPSKDGKGVFLAMKKAVETSGFGSDQISFVSAHATSTVQGDLSESNAISRYFNRNIHVYAIKSFIGHTLGASGIIESIFALAGLRKGWIPGTRNLMERDEQIPTNIYLARRPQKLQAIHALVNSLGFGGVCTSILLSTFDN